MAYDRTGTGRWFWVKSVGSADHPLDERWLDERDYLLHTIWFPKHPRSLKAGDLLAYYAAGRGVFPAVVELVSSEVSKDETNDRWPWTMNVRPRLVIPQLSDAPSIADVGLDSLRLRRQSHILLSDDEWERFRGIFLPPAQADGLADAA
jgi:hypothetical protein